MSPINAKTSSEPWSIAAAKLERQNKRIEATDVALTVPSLPEKHKQPARSKAKAWKPFDFAPGVSEPSQPHVVDAPVVESRINVFRAPSQASSLTRSMSRISARTHDSSYSESDRRDSSFLESDDFQVVTIATVISVDRDLFGQAKTGDTIRFRSVGIEEALAARSESTQHLDRIRASLA